MNEHCMDIYYDFAVRALEVQYRHKLEYDNKWHEHSSEMKMWSTTVWQNDTVLNKIDMWLTTNDAWKLQW